MLQDNIVDNRFPGYIKMTLPLSITHAHSHTDSLSHTHTGLKISTSPNHFLHARVETRAASFKPSSNRASQVEKCSFRLSSQQVNL